MKLFRKKTNKAAIGGNDKLARIIATAIVKMQSKWATWMQRQSERLSRKNKKRVLIFCCMVTAGYSAFVIISGVRGSHKMDIRISAIKKPVGIHDMPALKTDTAVLKKIHLFRRYLDSLAEDPGGSKVFDSIRNTRPGLIDSLDYVERMYQSQSK